MSQNNKNVPLGDMFLLAKIKNVFPNINWVTYNYIDEGWDHEVIILDGKIVFRFPIEPDYAAQLREEVDIVNGFKDIFNITIPYYKYIAPDDSFAGYEIVPSKALFKEYFNSLEADDIEMIASRLAGFLSIIHSLHIEDFKTVVVSDMPKWHQDMKDGIDKYLRDVLIKEDIALVDKIIFDLEHVLKQHLPQALIHGDVYARHIFWDDTTKKLGLIDFSDMNIGDPAFDFAELYEYGEDFVEKVYAKYTGPKDETFLNRAKAYGRWIGVFMMIDHFIYHKTSFEIARQTFDNAKDY